MKFYKMGWVAAGVMAMVLGATALSGFQANTAPKFATIDIEKVFDQSDLRNENNEQLRLAQQARLETFQFLNQNRAMAPGDAKKLSDLVTKAIKPAPADQTEIDRLKNVAGEATRKYRELQTKASPTDADKVALNDFNTKVQQNQVLLQQLERDYQEDIQTLQFELREKTLSRVRDVLRDIAGKQGYTIVFGVSSAPYAANDLTDACLKVLKK